MVDVADHYIDFKLIDFKLKISHFRTIFVASFHISFTVLFRLRHFRDLFLSEVGYIVFYMFVSFGLGLAT